MTREMEEELMRDREDEHKEEVLTEYKMFHDEEFFLQHTVYRDIVDLLDVFRKQCSAYGYESTNYFEEK